MDRFGVREMNLDWTKSIEMAVVITYYKKGKEHMLTYKSKGRSADVKYILCRRCNLKEIRDCRLVTGECSQTASDDCVYDDSGCEEEEESKGVAEDQMVESEKGSLLLGFQGEVETGTGWS